MNPEPALSRRQIPAHSSKGGLVTDASISMGADTMPETLQAAFGKALEIFTRNPVTHFRPNAFLFVALLSN